MHEMKIPCHWKPLHEVFLGRLFAKKTFIVDTPNSLGHFLLFVGQDCLGENYLTYSDIWCPRILLVKNMHYLFRIFRPLRINHICEDFRPHSISKQPHQGHSSIFLIFSACTVLQLLLLKGGTWPMLSRKELLLKPWQGE